MKKTIAILLALVMVFALCACGETSKPAATSAEVQTVTPNNTQTNDTPAVNDTPAGNDEPTNTEEPAAVMTHAEYAAADLDTEVCVETYVQAHQSWWDNQVTIYAQSPDGAYFIYNAACSEADAAKLVPGAKIRVTGVKSEWAGEVEIVDGSFEFISGDSFVADPTDVTALLGTAELEAHQNELVSFTGMTVEAYDESGAAFAYKNAENKTDDLYFKVSKDGQTYEFTVEYYLCGNETDVYKAVEAFEVGQTVDLEGFLYWYNGANPHITAAVVSEAASSVEEEGMSHADYIAAELDTEVSVVTYVQATQSWWNDTLTIYAQSPDGAYFIYNAACDEATANFLVPGTKIRVNGYKSEWAGEVEIVDATIEPFSNGYFLAEATDVTALLGTDALIEHQNELVSFKDMTFVSFTYKNAENKTDDLYVTVAKDGVNYDFCVEFYLCNNETEVYKTIEGLKGGETIDIEAFLYWYNGANPHITSVVVK